MASLLLRSPNKARESQSGFVGIWGSLGVQGFGVWDVGASGFQGLGVSCFRVLGFRGLDYGLFRCLCCNEGCSEHVGCNSLEPAPDAVSYNLLHIPEAAMPTSATY